MTPTETRLGASQVLSGPLGPQTLQDGDGARLLFDAVNAAGGIHGRKISFKTLEVGFDPKRAVENTRTLIRDDKMFMLFNSTGTAQTAAAVLLLLKESKTILFGPVTRASSLRNPTIPVVAEYLNLLKARSPEAISSASQFEGFVHAGLLVKVLRRTGRELSTASFTQTMQSAKEITFGRFSAKYSPRSHNGSDDVELAIIDAERRLRY